MYWDEDSSLQVAEPTIVYSPGVTQGALASTAGVYVLLDHKNSRFYLVEGQVPLTIHENQQESMVRYAKVHSERTERFQPEERAVSMHSRHVEA